MLTFNLTFAPDIKSGFKPDKAQENAMNLAASNWGKIFSNTATIDLVVNSTNNPDDDTLMSAGSNYTDYAPGFGNTEVVRNKALFGNDLNGSEADGEVTVNWGVNWELDFNETPNKLEDEYDFYSTFYHEITHALGFGSEITQEGTDAYDGGTLADGEAGAWGAFDQFISDSNGNKVINQKGLIDATKYKALLTGGTSAENKGLFFAGANAVAANGGNLVGLYSPANYSSGSSAHHLDDDNPALDGHLMLAETESGASARTLSAVGKGVLKDLGYTFADEASSPESKLTGSKLTTKSNSNYVKVDQLDTNDSLALTLKQVGVKNASEISIFVADDDLTGANKQQIASFSILESGKLAAGYTPEITLDFVKVAVGKFLQFEITENGKTRFSSFNSISDDTIELDFGSGTILTLQSVGASFKTNLLKEDAAAIDLTTQTGSTKLAFEVYREADYNNTVGFYKMDKADGSIVIDEVLGLTVKPGEAGYTEAALARQLQTKLSGSNGKVSSFSAEVMSDQFLGTFLIADGTDPTSSEVYFGHGSANSNGNDHVKMLGNNTFGFEDMSGLGDRDYNDIVVRFAVV